MQRIHQTIFIGAPAERVYDLARHFTLFRKAFDREQVSSASSSNLLSIGDTVTIHAKHFGKTRSVMLRITEMDASIKFVEEQVKGDLVSFRHEHHFKQIDNGTIMIDLIDYDLPRDFIGRMIGKIYFKKYLEKILSKRNGVIRSYAESDRWKPLLAR
jgi:ligand-binding SRPBCC domain-containing protein